MLFSQTVLSRRKYVGARLAALFVVVLSNALLIAAEPRNIILLIGDGMGPEQIKLGRIFANGDTGPLGMETLPHHALMMHNNALGGITDSAASATAMATGVKVANDVVSVRLPGDGKSLPTIVERAALQGKQSGLIVHGTKITDATPAAFAAHTDDRSDFADIVGDYLTETRPNLVYGQADAALTDAAAKKAGYQVAHNKAEMAAIAFSPGADHAFGVWNASEPTLAEMTANALALLEQDMDGFFLLVHDQDPDNGGHANNALTVKNGVLSMESAFEVAWDWAQTHPDTLLIVTADHETGGLKVQKNLGAGTLPNVTWSSKNHTATPVDVFAWGPNSELVTGQLDNTDIYRIMTVPEPHGAMLLLFGATIVCLMRARVRLGG